MSSPAFSCKALAVALAVALGAAAPARAAELGADEVDLRYNRLLEAERTRTNRDNLLERLASGLAALAIGLYGYYNDDRGELTKIVYSATQTAGVVMVSNAILDANQPSMLLLTDRYLNHRKELGLERFKRGMVLIEQKRTLGEYKSLAYTSLLLASMYGYDGYRSSAGDEALKNVFYFLSFNFALISAANFYRLSTLDLTMQSAEHRRYHVYLTALPYGSVTVLF